MIVPSLNIVTPTRNIGHVIYLVSIIIGIDLFNYNLSTVSPYVMYTEKVLQYKVISRRSWYRYNVIWTRGDQWCKLHLYVFNNSAFVIVGNIRFRKIEPN